MMNNTTMQNESSEQLEEAVSALNRGDLAVALKLATALRLSSPSPEAVYVELMAMVRQNMIRTAQRLLSNNEAHLKQWPDGEGMAAHVHGRIAMAQGRAEIAVPHFRLAMERLPKNQSCVLDYAEALFHTNQFAAAHDVYLQALVLGPVIPIIYANLAACAMRMQKFDHAFAYSYTGWNHYPTALGARQIAQVMVLSNNVWGAIKHFNQAVSLGDESVDAWQGLADCYRRLRYYHRTIRYLKKVLAVAPPELELNLLIQLMQAYERIGDTRGSLGYCERMAELHPEYYGYLLNIANVYQTENNYSEALKWVDKAERLAPDSDDVKYTRGFIQLLQGNWIDGCRNYEARWNTVAFKQKYAAVADPIQSPMWNGTDSLEGKLVMAMCEQGAGDIIQYSIYIPRLIARGARVHLLGPPSMYTLLKTMPWIEDVHDNYFKIPPHDYHVSLMTIPLYEGTTLDTIPVASEPFLSAPRTRARFSDKFTVALSWAGDHKHGNDAWRSMKTHFLYDFIKAFPDVQFVSLQFPPHDQVLKRYLKAGLLIDGMENAKSFADTAATIDAVDLVISVDTATAHVAGAMHKPIWLLVSNYPDWRWGADETHTRWYPTMKMYRQKRMHDWRELLRRVAADLRAQISVSGKAIASKKSEATNPNRPHPATSSPLRKKLGLGKAKKNFPPND
jgi:tetratricopeptide (TPR) repeat protein